VTELETLERHFRELFRFLDLGSLIARPTDAYAEETASFQQVEFTANSITKAQVSAQLP
jgi:hypothetical protein